MTTKTKPGFVTAMFLRDKEDQVWLVELREEPRVHSFGKSLKDAEQNIRDAAALWYQQEVNLKLEYHGLNDETLRLREKVLELREQAADLQLNAMTALRYVATLMEDEGVSRRDAARLLGISHQRLQQLLDEARKKPVPSAADIGRWSRGPEQ